MQAILNIPQPLYERLALSAEVEGTSIEELILLRIAEAEEVPVEVLSNGLRIPAVRAKNPGSLSFGPEGVFEHIPFP